MNKFFSLLVFGFVLLLASATAEAQFIEDALRYSIPNGIITPRVAGFNVSYHGLSDDIGALMYNPAGLTLASGSEISVGFGFTHNSTETDYLNMKSPLNTNDEIITHLGIIVPLDEKNKKASVGIGYFLESNFENNMEFNAFNPSSTMIAWKASQGGTFDDNFAANLFLADKNFKTPITDSLMQSSFIQEKGGLHNLTGGLAYDISDVISVGFSIVGKWGTYKYTKDYTETDIYNKYSYWDSTNFTNVDFNQLLLTESFIADISGISGSVGFQARLMESLRFGVTIKLPTWYEISENSSQFAISHFDKGDTLQFNLSGRTTYNVTTPFVYCAGISFNFEGLTLAGGVEYSDASQIEFSQATTQVEQLNKDILQQLTGQVTYGFGAEYKLPVFPAFIRASYAMTTSPYIDNNPNSNLSIISFGAGLFVGEKVRLDALVRMRDFTDKRINYGTLAYNFTTKPVDFGLQLTYRY
ncbi:MAG: hypothetical protein EPN82_04505 [Bacteroidetes bacterium]|nr:MAG: hypothetical protein EPN82_04505 [Bacteroidota bacterium]